MNIMLLKVYVTVSVYLASLKNEEGQGMAEYGLILALIAVLLIASLGFLKGGIQTAFNAATTGLGGSITGT